MTQIDYFFGLGSPWAYLGFRPLQDIAGTAGAVLVPHVIPLIEENGGIYSRNRPAPRRAYWLADLKRWAARRELPLVLEGRAGLSDSGPAANLVVAAYLAGEDWQSLAWAFHSAFWGRAEDIGVPETHTRIAASLGLDAAKLGKIDITTRSADSLALAREKGVFGLPSYIVKGELFWGQDSLPFLVDHLARPDPR